jgi:hypothetical protein
MNESYFTKDRHMPATMKPGEDFSAAMFVNDPNRRGPPPMLRPGSGDPTQALEWAPPDVAGNLSATIAAGDRFGADRHARDLMGESGGTSDRLTARDIYQEVVDSTNRQEPPQPSISAAPAAAPSNPFGASRHQLPEQQAPAAETTQWFMAGAPTPGSSNSPSSAPPIVSSGASASVTHAALQAAVAASSRSIDALVRARNVLEQQIGEERGKHLQLVKLAEQAQAQMR